MDNNIIKLTELIKENPELEVKILVASEEMSDCAFTLHKIDSVNISDWYYWEEYGKYYNDVDKLADELQEINFEWYAEKCTQKAKSLMKKVICVYTGA